MYMYMHVHAGLFGEGEEDDWMTGSITSKDSPKPVASKKATPSSKSADLFGDLRDDVDGEDEEDLFAEPAKKPAAAEPKKKVCPTYPPPPLSHD